MTTHIFKYQLIQVWSSKFKDQRKRCKNDKEVNTGGIRTTIGL